MPNKLPQKPAEALARHLRVPIYVQGRKLSTVEMCEALRVAWPHSKTDGGGISFPAIILHVSLPIPPKYMI